MSIATGFIPLRNLLLLASLVGAASLPMSLPAQIPEPTVAETIPVPVVNGSPGPCMESYDVDFGRSPDGLPMTYTKPFRICNSGDTELRFLNPPLTWSDQHFYVHDSVMAALASRTLSPGECCEIPVNFEGEWTGSFSTMVKINSTSQCGRDSAYWNAYIFDLVSVPVDAAISGDISIAPNPSGRAVSLDLQLPRAAAVRVDIVDQQGAIVATVVDETLPQGVTMRLVDLTSFPAGNYRVVMRGDGQIRSRQLLIVW